MMKIFLNIALIFLICSLAVGQSEDFEAVAPEKVPEVLKMIAAKTKENFERIHTWQGEIEISEFAIYKGEQALCHWTVMRNWLRRGHVLVAKEAAMPEQWM